MAQLSPILRAMTPEARHALGADEVVVDVLPFRVGRESRARSARPPPANVERREGRMQPNNELYLLDRGERIQISREHFQIQQRDDGSYELLDRHSACGTVVDDRPVGGRDEGGRSELRSGSTIRVGTAGSPYLFKFVLSTTCE